MFREKFGSRVRLYEAEGLIETEYLDGPFRYMRSSWNFKDTSTSNGNAACEVSFHVDFEFRNMILQTAIGMVFNEAMQRIVRAFEDRAHQLYQ